MHRRIRGKDLEHWLEQLAIEEDGSDATESTRVSKPMISILFIF